VISLISTTTSIVLFGLLGRNPFDVISNFKVHIGIDSEVLKVQMAVDLLVPVFQEVLRDDHQSGGGRQQRSLQAKPLVLGQL